MLRLQLQLKAAIIVLASMLATNGWAAELWCSGTVENVGFHSPGRLMLKLSTMNTPVFICSTDETWAPAGANGYSTTPAACKTLYATLLAARTSGTALQTVLFDGGQVPAACNGWANWANANVRYVVH